MEPTRKSRQLQSMTDAMIPTPYFKALQGSPFIFALKEILRVCHLQSSPTPDERFDHQTRSSTVGCEPLDVVA
jgi:hypothetical protein